MKYFYLHLLIILVCAAQLQAQSGSSSPLDNDLNQLFNKEKTGIDAFSSAANLEKIPFERAVNPETYICGAGDVLSLNLVMPVNAQYLLPISADGSLNIPRIGSISLTGKSLKQAGTEIFSILNKKYSTAQGAVSLSRPRLIYVTITGEVENPGMYTLTAATPVSVAYYFANSKNEQSTKPANVFQQPQAKDPGYYNKFAKQFFGEEPRSHKSLRHIFIHRSTGDIETADLIKYQATHEEKLNPMLREGDEIVVTLANYSTIGIYGAVKKPGEYEFVEGDDISTLMKIGVGLNAELHPVSAELIRAAKDGNDEHIQINISEIEQDRTALAPGDKLIIKGSSPKTSTGVVAVKGEVNLPGVYPIVPGKTLLSEVVKMAGGFTNDAYPVLSEMYRPQLAFLPIGDVYTMGPEQAAKACDLLGVRQVVPMHYGTFPMLTGTPARFRELVEPRGVQVLELKPGETAS